ncbi:ribosome biogenesis GTP-binding protein YihA/YsxC [Minwuia thermotolerans]|uniref:Probable GTP-binding protein EngB n=1 Tax=Minwuia thermotolerans TaxID=2056226 RepID=A0A2M9G6N1_9PROT|nr:YihA family ribosome biogenesis GTP-binding protein [Minwuia thermotolerans]
MVNDETPDPEAGRLLFAAECRFVISVAWLEQLPPADLPEVAFIGRSNVGKSSLVNALTGRKALAKTSNTPGRTQQLNFFDLDGRLMLVDLPGYGFAKAPKGAVEAWTRLIRAYLRGRPNLLRVCLLIDARHGIKKPDEEFMDMLDKAAVVYQVVLTKTDKLKSGELAKVSADTEARLKRRVAAFPRQIATSAEKGDGIADLRAELAMLASAGGTGL